MTTSKHINYVAKEYGLVKQEAPIQEEKQEQSFKAVAAVAMMGELFGDTQKEKNDWKVRMLRAGLGEGLSMPDDWDTLNENEKARRLNLAIKQLK